MSISENDYIKATNRVKVSTALRILNDVLAGDGYGVTPKELSDIYGLIRELETKLFSSYELTESK